MDAHPITPFLASAEQVKLALADSADFRGFLALAQKSSGEVPTQAVAINAAYRLAEGRADSQLAPMRLDDVLMVTGQAVAIHELIASTLLVNQARLIHSLWRLADFVEVKAWLKAMRALIRYTPDGMGGMQGQLLLAETIIPIVETVERRDYVLPNGDMASDAITRNLGLRAKVFAIDRALRQPRAVVGHSIMDRLSRTVSKGSV